MLHVPSYHHHHHHQKPKHKQQQRRGNIRLAWLGSTLLAFFFDSRSANFVQCTLTHFSAVWFSFAYDRRHGVISPSKFAFCLLPSWGDPAEGPPFLWPTRLCVAILRRSKRQRQRRRQVRTASGFFQVNESKEEKCSKVFLNVHHIFFFFFFFSFSFFRYVCLLLFTASTLVHCTVCIYSHRFSAHSSRAELKLVTFPHTRSYTERKK